MYFYIYFDQVISGSLQSVSAIDFLCVLCFSKSEINQNKLISSQEMLLFSKILLDVDYVSEEEDSNPSL